MSITEKMEQEMKLWAAELNRQTSSSQPHEKKKFSTSSTDAKISARSTLFESSTSNKISRTRRSCRSKVRNRKLRGFDRSRKCRVVVKINRRLGKNFDGDKVRRRFSRHRKKATGKLSSG